MKAQHHAMVAGVIAVMNIALAIGGDHIAVVGAAAWGFYAGGYFGIWLKERE